MHRLNVLTICCVLCVHLLLQDIGNLQTPWGSITAVGLNPYQGSAVQSSAVQSSGRKLLQNFSSVPLLAEGDKPVCTAASAAAAVGVAVAVAEKQSLTPHG